MRRLLFFFYFFLIQRPYVCTWQLIQTVEISWNSPFDYLIAIESDLINKINISHKSITIRL